jgi:hypothetical protein
MMRSLRNFFTAEAQGPDVKPMATRAPRRHLPTLYPVDSAVRVMVENPKRKNTQAHDRFEKYADCATVGEAIAAGITYKDIDHDYTSGFISLNGSSLHG